MKIELTLEFLAYLCSIAPLITDSQGKYSALDEETPGEIPLGFYEPDRDHSASVRILEEFIRQEGGLIWFCSECNGFVSKRQPCTHRCRWKIDDSD